MKNRKKVFNSILGLSVLAIAAGGLSGAAFAKPDRPLNAATTDKGTGCLVRDGDGNYHFDAQCKWHTVVKRDKDGNLTRFSYQDKGTLPEDAPHPDSALRNSMPWPGCPEGISEVTTPSGQYSSECRFSN